MASSSAAKTHQKPHRRLPLNPQAPPFLRRSYYYYPISRQPFAPPPPRPTYQWVPVVPCVVSAPPNPMINNANVDLQGAVPVAKGPRRFWRPQRKVDLQGAVPVAKGPRRVWRPQRKVDLQGASTSGGGGGRKKRSSRRGGGGGGGDIIPFPCTLEDLFRSGTTTVMIKNIPNQFRRTDLLHILGCHCWHQNSIDLHKSMFDFVYLPMDFNKFWHEKKVKNLGFAFVNFTTPFGAQRFYESFHKHEWVVSYNRKVCEITTARIQGKKALVRNFKTKIFWCHSDEYLPAVVEPACNGNMLPNATTVGHLAGRPSRSS